MATGNGSGLNTSSPLNTQVQLATCAYCKNLDDTTMVDCYICHRWFHAKCAGVDESASENDWSCVGCVIAQSQVPPVSTAPGAHGQSGQTTQANQPDAVQELKNQIESLQRELEKVKVRENQRVQFSMQQNTSLREDYTRTGAIPKANSTTIGITVPTDGNDDAGLSEELRALEEKHALQRRQLEERYALFQRRRTSTRMDQTMSNPRTGEFRLNVSGTTSNNSSFSSSVNHELSKSQLAARQAVARDLPTFSGNPEEWPLFFASFESSTRICWYSDEENMLRLQRSLKGKARGKALESVRCRLLHPSNLHGVMTTLKTLFGRPEVIVHSLVTRIREMPSPKAEKLNTLIDFGVAVQNVVATIKACGLDEYLCNIALLQELVDRLPPTIKLNWALHSQTLPWVSLSSFGDWLEKMVQAACVVTTAPIEPFINKRTRKQDSFMNVHSGEEESKPESTRTALKRCVVCDGECSSVEACRTFQAMSISSRWSTLREKKMCKKCLQKHFGACNIKTACGKNGCTFMHHPMLHDETRYRVVESGRQATNQNCNTHSETAGKTLFRYIPVTLHGKGVSVDTYAFLDDGSSATFMEHGLLKELKLEGKPSPLCLNWTAGQQREERESVRLTLKISGAGDQGPAYVLPKVHTVKTLSLPLQSISVPELSARYEYLKGLPINSYKSVSPRILIGIDNCHVGHALKSKEGRENEPVAAKTRLGWLIYGPCSVTAETPGRNFSACHSFHICPCSADEDSSLNAAWKEYYSIDSLGVLKPTEPLLSRDDERALQLLSSGTHLKGCRYETVLLWRKDDIRLPDNRAMAEKRLSCLEKRMNRDPALAETLRIKMKEYEQKGYIRMLTPEEAAVKHPRKWYLPIFPVVNPNKPGKVRVVWDAAATFKGISLNSVLLTGPDQLSSLLSVLHRFREYRFAIVADLREMFHQVLTNLEDQYSQLFLWWDDGDTSRPPRVYAMKVMTFGATCSPSCAQYVKNLNAERFRQQFPRAAECIQKDHYVDDWLTSVENEEEAAKLAKEVQFIHGQGGFELHHWLSNSKKVLESVTTAGEGEKELNLSSQMATEKVLGMWWRISSDTFTFKLSPKHDDDLLSGRRIPTKRELLKTLMTIYDPLGLIGCFLMFLKILLQEVWRAGTDWDDEIPAELVGKWKEWLRVLPQVEEISIPRCYRLTTTIAEDTNIQLHVFVDAGRDGLVAVAYLRFEQAGTIECALVGAKARVAPLKYMSVPHLELQAAVIGTRLATSIAESHRLKISERFFWTDSRDVICWIRSDHRRYSTFVAHRIGEIMEVTEIREWKWISTRLNPADEGTKWQRLPDLSPTGHWFRGPEFLWKPRCQWPADTEDPGTSVEEIRASVLHHNIREPVLQFERFSRWKHLHRAVAYVLRYRSNLHRKIRSPLTSTPLTQEELQQAEWEIYRHAQQEAFPEECDLLSSAESTSGTSNLPLPKNSKLYKLNPFIDAAGVLRMRSRISLCQFVEDSANYPILLPKRHHLTDLVIADYHCRYKHLNHDTVVSQIRLKFHIPQLRSEYKRVYHACQDCKIRRASPHAPLMADLPAGRMAAFSRPFSYTGIDYFGPMQVVVGKRVEKRWGVLMTCLTTRAIHIEIAHSLSTDSCILALRNFVAHRGAPIEIFSDRGTNFIGADRELRRELQKVDQDKMMEHFVEPNTKWTFNPPAAPHFGGSWERLIQSVKKVLHQTETKRLPTDEILRSRLSEAMMIINSRPLTDLPLDVESSPPLTPNHFLLGSSNGSKPPIALNNTPKQLTNSWIMAQEYADEFWNRWITEYLPTLTRRSKWFQPARPIQVGDVALIVDNALPRNCWPKGRVIEVVRSKDGQVRRATLQTANGRLERPAVKIAVLDVGSSESKSSEGPDVLGGSVTDVTNQQTGNTAKRASPPVTRSRKRLAQ